MKTSRKIAKNTIVLYVRMLFTLFISLYTSRITLEFLGVEDFGIYNLVAGIVVMFNFLQSSLSGSYQRFFNYYLGTDDKKALQKTFLVSLCLQVIFLVLIFSVLFSVGYWYVYNRLNIPTGKHDLASLVFVLTIFLFGFRFLRIPFYAIIVAYEKMTLFAFLSIIEAVFKLGAVLLLPYIASERLIVYANSLLIIAFVLLLLYGVLVYYNTGLKVGLVWERQTAKSLLGFTSWNLLGGVFTLGSVQMSYIIANLFFGVIVNAAVGVTTQVSQNLFAFVSNFQVAFNPQIMQLYARNKKSEFNSLVLKAAKISSSLYLIFALPFVFTAQFVLSIWLKEVPQYAVIFCQLALLNLLFEAMSGPLWAASQAQGRVKEFNLVLSFVYVFNLPILYIAFYFDMPAYYLYLVKIGIDICALFWRLIHCRRIINISTFVLKVVIPPIILLTLIVTGFYWLGFDGVSSIKEFVYTVFITASIVALFVFFVYFDEKEREFVMSVLKKKNK